MLGTRCRSTAPDLENEIIQLSMSNWERELAPSPHRRLCGSTLRGEIEHPTGGLVQTERWMPALRHGHSALGGAAQLGIAMPGRFARGQ